MDVRLTVFETDNDDDDGAYLFFKIIWALK